MEKTVKEIEYLVLESPISNYRISQATGIAQTSLSNYSTGKSEMKRMPLINAIKLHEYYKKELGELMELIKKVEEFELSFDEGYDPLYKELEYEDGPSDNLIGHYIDGTDIEVYFAECPEIKDFRQAVYNGNKSEQELTDFLGGLNDLEEEFDYEKVVAYNKGNGFEWV